MGPGARRDLPSGTVTFLFTDIEGSTSLLQEMGPNAFVGILEAHSALLRRAISEHGGVEVRTEGDSFFVAFDSAPSALAAAVEGQRALARHPWPGDRPIRVRMGLHTGEGRLGGDDYLGLDVHRAARIGAAGHGGQILLSASTRTLVAQAVPRGVALQDIGRHRLKDLPEPEHLSQVVIEGLAGDFPPLRTLETAPTNLPRPPSSFVGRERELAETRELLSRNRLLTLTGPGGTGKTRLALQLAAAALGDFEDGAFFVALDTVADPDGVPSAIAEALSLAPSTGPRLEQVLRFLRGKTMLLALDNFEQVLGAAPTVSDIVRAAPAVKVLVTSRAPLRLSGEQEYPVAPLRVPGPGLADHHPDELIANEAVTLFVERARSARPGFRLDRTNGAAIAEIVVRLDGLPLAVELAAARTRMLTPATIADRLGERLTLLDGGARDLPLRQQTLENTIAWSYELLPEPVRRLMNRMAVFSGGATLEELENVCVLGGELGIDLLAGLEVLVDHSLVQQREVEGEPRFRMLETIRAFGLERLGSAGEEEEVRRRHAVAFLDLAERARHQLTGRDQVVWLDRLDREHPNMRIALRWATDAAEGELAHRLAASLWRFWQMRGHLREADAWFDQVLAMPSPGPRARAAALTGAGSISYWRADLARARSHWRSALELYRRLNDEEQIAETLYNLSFAIGFVEEKVGASALEEAKSQLHEALEIFQRSGNEMGQAKVMFNLGNAAYMAGDYSTARRELTGSVEAFRALGETFLVGWALRVLGRIAFELEGPDAAARLHAEALRTHSRSEDASAVILHLVDHAHLAVARDDLVRAARLRGAMQRLMDEIGGDVTQVGYRQLEEVTDALATLDEETESRAQAEGAAMTLGEAVEYALEAVTPREGSSRRGSSPSAGRSATRDRSVCG